MSSKWIIFIVVTISLAAWSAIYWLLPNNLTNPKLVATVAIQKALQKPGIAPRNNPDGTTDYALISSPMFDYPGQYWVLRLPSDTYTYRSEDTINDNLKQLAKNENFRPASAEPNEYINFHLSLPDLKPVSVGQHMADPYGQHTMHVRPQNALRFMEKRSEEDPAFEGCKVVRQVAPGIIELKPKQPPSKEVHLEQDCFVPNDPNQDFTGYRITNDAGEFIMALNCSDATAKRPRATCGWDLDLDNIRGILIDFPMENVPPEKLRELIQRLISFLKTSNVDSGQFSKNSSFSFKN
jgi:hypothetical protein